MITKLQKTRLSKRLTIRKLEKLSGISRQTISKIEKGHTQVQVMTWVKLCRALEVKLEEIM